MIEVTLEYKRDAGTVLSTGRVLSNEGGLITEEGEFSGIEYRKMIAQLHDVLKNWADEEPVDVILQRTDREGLLPYKLDGATVHLIRTDPIAAVAALSVPDRSPSGAAKRAVAHSVPIVVPPIAIGDDVLADAFGDQVYFNVKGHELECPGCGFWGIYTTPGLLNDEERGGASFKTMFGCKKRCGCERFPVTCNKKWGYVSTKYLLEETKLAAFYFPRAWNGGKPWVTRETLQKLYDQYKEEKEQALCKAQ
jgi:hypothetical protein